MTAFLVCCPPRAKGPQDGPGCATPAVGDPCRTRTCIRRVSGSRPTTGRNGPWMVAEAPRLRPGAALRRRHVAGDPSFGRDMTTTRPLVPFVGDLFSCQGAIWARRTKAFAQIIAAPARRRESLFFGEEESCPGTRAPPLRVCFLSYCVRCGNQKSRSLAAAARAVMDP
jgi:hypothetical protein